MVYLTSPSGKNRWSRPFGQSRNPTLDATAVYEDFNGGAATANRPMIEGYQRSGCDVVIGIGRKDPRYCKGGSLRRRARRW